MHILNSILLPSLLLTGLSVYFQSIGYHNSEKMPKLSSVQQYLVAQDSGQDIARRGSGRIGTDATS